MRHMRIVHNNYLLVLILSLMTVLSTAIVAQQELTTPMLDLTKPVPREQQMTGIYGSSVGGIEGQPLPSGYLLPLKIDLTSSYPTLMKADEKFTVEVRLRNTGTSEFFLPASQNGVAVLQHEGKGRRTFALNLIFEDPKSWRRTSSVVAIAVGSEMVKNSLLAIGPGKEVRVVFTGDLGSIGDWFRHDLDRIQIRVEASEMTFEDRRYFLKSQSQPIVSDNAESIKLTER